MEMPTLDTHPSLPAEQFALASAVAGDWGCGVCSCCRNWLVCELGTGTSTDTGIGCAVGAGCNCVGCSWPVVATHGTVGGGGGGGGGDKVWMKTECVGAAGDALRSRIACAADRSSSADVRISDVRISDVRISDVRISDVRTSDVRISGVRISDVRISDIGWRL